MRLIDSSKMTYEMWKDIQNFKPKEFGTTGMSNILIYTLQDMRNYTGRRINIHSGYRLMLLMA
jgi:hypothetical protein